MSICTAGAHKNLPYWAGLLWALYSAAGWSNGPTLSSAINWSASRASITFSAGSLSDCNSTRTHCPGLFFSTHVVRGCFFRHLFFCLFLFLQHCLVSWLMTNDDPAMHTMMIPFLVFLSWKHSWSHTTLNSSVINGCSSHVLTLDTFSTLPAVASVNQWISNVRWTQNWALMSHRKWI